MVLVSGNGSNLQAILDACAADRLPARVAAVVSDRAGARALDRAASVGVPAVHVGAHEGEDRRHYDRRLAEVVAGHEPTSSCSPAGCGS